MLEVRVVTGSNKAGAHEEAKMRCLGLALPFFALVFVRSDAECLNVPRAYSSWKAPGDGPCADKIPILYKAVLRSKRGT